ncbi:UNVERIFIED_CONTAM: Pre-splicing factor clf1 [Sesamum calycinum]|uniref:Pre-splicing factor clf1 n=1 Tax=Sesamum calycinum TaxID=2727403 RepID=A0AAW2L979_9LAMI
MAAQFEIHQLNIDRASRILVSAIGMAANDKKLNEPERFLSLQIGQPALDMPELLWKAHIDFEISEAEYEKTRTLYERVLNRTKHLKAWIGYAKFEASAMDEGLQESDLRESDYEQKR